MTDWSRLVVPGARELAPFDLDGTVAQVRALRAHEHAAKLDWNENLFGPLTGVVDAARDALANAALYPIEAYDDFRIEVGGFLGTDATRIVPGHGTQALIGTVASAFLQPGDRVVQPAATFYLYELVSVARGATVHRVPMRGQSLDLEALAAKARGLGARIAWVCDPNNPTGTAMRQEEWDDFLAALPEGCVAVADEAYADYLPPERRVRRVADVEAGRPVVVLRSFSKFYGLAGLRLGYAVVDGALAAYLSVIDEPCNVNCAALAAGMASLRATDAASVRRREVAEAREVLMDGLRDVGLEPFPSEASFVLARVDGDDTQLACELARGGVLVRAGSEIGLPGHIRVAVGPLPLMELFTGALRRALSAGA